jgi:cytochrome b involved in lipid metabolism
VLIKKKRLNVMELLRQLKKLVPVYPKDMHHMHPMETYSYETALQKIREHRKWMIIDDSIVDVSNYLQKHPGGTSILEENAGTDATLLFEKVCHSNEAYETMLEMKVAHVRR